MNAWKDEHGAIHINTNGAVIKIAEPHLKASELGHPNLSVRKAEIQSAGWRRDAWFVFDGECKISQPFPTRAAARAELRAMIDEA